MSFQKAILELVHTLRVNRRFKFIPTQDRELLRFEMGHHGLKGCQVAVVKQNPPLGSCIDVMI